MRRFRVPYCGFTLVETLVSIAVVALLIALLLPVLSGTRQRTQQAACAAQMSSHWKAIVLYTDAHNGLFPTADWTRYEPPSYPPRQQGDPWFHPSGYGFVPRNWSTVMPDTYDGDPLHLSLVCPGDTRARNANLELRNPSSAVGQVFARDIGMGVSYSLSYSFFLDPRALARSQPAIDERSFVTQRLDSILHPALKGALKDGLPVHDAAQKQADIGVAFFPTWFNVGAADGHVNYRSTQSFRPGLVFGDRSDPLTGVSRSPATAIDFTVGGILGRDW